MAPQSRQQNHGTGLSRPHYHFFPFILLRSRINFTPSRVVDIIPFSKDELDDGGSLGLTGIGRIFKL